MADEEKTRDEEWVLAVEELKLEQAALRKKIDMLMREGSDAGIIKRLEDRLAEDRRTSRAFVESRLSKLEYSVRPLSRTEWVFLIVGTVVVTNVALGLLGVTYKVRASKPVETPAVTQPMGKW